MSRRQTTPAGQYEAYNPSPCTARVAIVNDGGIQSQTLGDVPSGGRVILSVPQLAPGARIVASALNPDGTDCDPRGQLQVRRVQP